VQPKLLLEQNPYIHEVFVATNPSLAYDMVIVMPVGDQAIPMTIKYQQAAGITNPTVNYWVYTLQEYNQMYDALFANRKKKIIGWQVNWEWKAYQCTPELLAKRIGAPHRQIDKVIAELDAYDEFTLIPCGYDRTVSQYDARAHDAQSFAKTASLIKQCDWFIGSEGGLTNLSAGVGTKTIYTTDYIMQNYGPNGHIKQIQNPQMGPCVYFPNNGHIALDPCIADADIASTIRKLVNAK
jgi:hypothetical protein